MEAPEGWTFQDGSGNAVTAFTRSERFIYDGVRRIQEIVTDPILADGEGNRVATMSFENETRNGGSGGSGGGGSGSASVLPTMSVFLRAQYVWGPGDGPANGVDELLCQVDPNASGGVGGVQGKPWFILTDAQGDVVSIVGVAQDLSGNQVASVAGQWTYSPYGEVLTYDELAAHPSVVFGHKTLAIDRLDGPTLTWQDESEPGEEDWSFFETRRLEPGARLLAYARNRTLDIDTGRWLQVDPNASGTVTPRTACLGSAPTVSAIVVQLEERIADGLGLFEYAGSEVIQRRDPLGLYSGDDFVEDLFGASFSLPTPGDFIRGALSEMVSEYASRQTWDVEWASDFNLGDNEHSRTENLWVTVALMRGLRDCFEIGFGDYKINLLDGFDMASVGGGGARTPKSRIHSPRGVAGYAKTVSVNGFHANVYSRPGGGRSYVLFDDKAVRANVRVNVTTRTQERIDANKAAGLSKTPDGWAWHHHSTKRGIMQLVPRPLHEKVGHLGRADW